MIDLKSIYDPVVATTLEKTYLIKLGAQNIQLSRNSANSVSNSLLKFNVTTPSTNVCVDRNFILTSKFILTAGVGGTAVPNPIGLTSISSGLRQFPIHSICDNLSLRLNASESSYQPSKIIHALLKYNCTAEDRSSFMSGSATKPDFINSYAGNAADVGLRNPFTSYGNSIEEDSRNLSLFAEIVNNQVVITVSEQLMISPLLWASKQQHAGFYGIQVIEVDLTMSNLSRLLSGAILGFASTTDPNALFNADPSTLTVSLAPAQSDHQLQIRFLTPPNTMPKPAVFNYPYHQIKRFTQTAGALVGGGSSNITMNSITLNEIFKRMYLWVGPVEQPNFTASVQQPNYFCRVDSVNITFNVRNGIMANLNTYDLYQRCSINGLEMTYKGFSKYLGSVLCFEAGTDIPLDMFQCAGVRGNFQIQIQVNYTDLRPAGSPLVDFEASLVFINEGVFTVKNASCQYTTGSLTEDDVSKASQSPVLLKNMDMGSTFEGGGWKDFTNWVSGAYKTVKNAIETAIPVVRDISGAVSGIASMIPHPKAQAVGAVSGTINKGLGGRSSGGRRMRTSSLARRL